MRKNTLGFALGALLLTGSITVVVKISNETNQPAARNPVSIFTVLQAHGGYNDQARSRFTQNATMTTYVQDDLGISQDQRERKLKFSIDRSIVRYDKTSLHKSHMFLFDGHTMVRTTYQPETQPEVKVLNGNEAEVAKFQPATFGLLPILKRLSDPHAQVVYMGTTEKGNRFHVKTPRGVWDIYTNSNHLIERVEVKGATVTYGDYRKVDGLNLPFYQQVRKGNNLLWEIKFDAVDFNPVFADGFFKSDFL